ncbi:MAG: IMP cyclohydrolase [Eubacteriales bacterium]|nr:IMP cyclohydrolase [Eubacteriales bacterium]
MKLMDVNDLLAHNRYPGRGILLGRSADGMSAVIAYFIMGRSENSRNRVFTPTEDGIITEAHDPSLMTDPSLIIYTPVRTLGGNVTIVTNGDQTDTVAEFLLSGRSFEDALRTRTFEPDAPNYTPRISGLLTAGDGRMSYRLSILKSDGGMADSAQRFFFEYPEPRAGEGHLIHTYASDGNPLPSFAGEPIRVTVDCADIDAFATGLWNALDMQNKVSLFVRTVELISGYTVTRILNQRN